MKYIGDLIILLILSNGVYSFLYPKYKDNVAPYLKTPKNGAQNSRSSEIIEENKVRNNYLKVIDDASKTKQLKNKLLALRGGGNILSKTNGNNVFKSKGIEDEKRGFQKDVIMNSLAKRRDMDPVDSISSSSSQETRPWKDEWNDIWTMKKMEALNASVPKGDMVNMVAARPWGVPCGDPNQHDMPWGTCMLPMECEAEYRIYRGDFSCGRTQFVCCALQLTNYDMYQGFDLSFDESSFATDSEEIKERNENSKEKRRKKRKQEKRNRQRDRMKRKSRIKKNIRKIVREIKKILNRSYRNGTTMRKKKTKQLKKFIKELKKKYRQDRQSVKEIHEMEMVKVDARLMKKLNDIKHVNRNFIHNATFRDIVVNGTINKKQARMLVEAYPELEDYFGARRSGMDLDAPTNYLEYDIEYGYLYY